MNTRTNSNLIKSPPSGTQFDPSGHPAATLSGVVVLPEDFEQLAEADVARTE